MRNRKALTYLTVVVVLLLSSSLAASAASWERADVVGQGAGGPTVAVNGAAILRTGNGLTARMSMPTPEPGSYDYSSSPTANNQEGSPEAFTLWVFVFYNPDACDGPCDEPDIAHKDDVVAGAYNAGGHFVAGPNLSITGHVNQHSKVFPPPGATSELETLGEALDMGFDIDDAEVHLAIAPHGALDSDLLPQQISTPAGPPSLWWLAFFK